MSDDIMTIAQFRDRVRARVLERHPDWILTDSDEGGCALVVTLGDGAGMRIGHPRPLMAPGLAFCRPDGTYEYRPITADDAAGARA